MVLSFGVLIGYVAGLMVSIMDVVELVGDSVKKNGSGGRSGESDLQSSVV
jgi:hypothetical protein